ncbi:MKRN2 opposite strand protein [Stigmatopora nigra]
MEPVVLRVRHECLRDIFCFSLPALCPACHRPLAGGRPHRAPVSVPDPLGDGHGTSCRFLVAWTGRDSDGVAELHAGISDTSGVVYNYTERGVLRERRGWERCLSFPLLRPDAFHLLAQWDGYLERFSRGPSWDPTRRSFCDDSHNCLTFCVAFVNGVLAAEGGHGDVVVHAGDLTRVTAPAVRRAREYAALRRHLRRHPFYVAPSASPPPS